MKVQSQQKCIGCGVRHFVEVPNEEYGKWLRGELIQVAMPDVSVTAREILITGTCQKAWDDMFGDGEDDDKPLS
jgi:NOL1/NOP2/fmu family ribosome biogenesis protein